MAEWWLGPTTADQCRHIPARACVSFSKPALGCRICLRMVVKLLNFMCVDCFSIDNLWWPRTQPPRPSADLVAKWVVGFGAGDIEVVGRGPTSARKTVSSLYPVLFHLVSSSVM